MSAPPALPDLASRIDAEHRAAEHAAQTAMGHALECGRLLIQAKAALPHGKWLSWLAANTSVSARQSQRYMRFATAVLEGKCDVTSFLTIESALEGLATVASAKAEPRQPPARAIQDKRRWEARFEESVKSLSRLYLAGDRDGHIHERALAERDPDLRGAISQASVLLYNALGDRPRTIDTEFQQPPEGRPRLDEGKLEKAKQLFLALRGVDRVAFARWVLEYELRQTDLAPQQKARLAKVLEALTSYGPGVAA